jgi:hypothetical protein
MKLPKLSRNQWVLIVLLFILTGEVVHHIWTHWGLITIHSKNQSLSQVIRSIEKQGHVTIKTNMDLTKPVEMNVDEVNLSEALETLSAVTDSRWRLAYYVGPDKATVASALSTFTSGQRNEGWKMIYLPLPNFGDEASRLGDPRDDTWVVKTASQPTLQGYLHEAAKNVSASFLVPNDFNPPVNAPPKSGAISSALPKLASTAKAKYEEVFLLQNFSRQADGDRRDRTDGERRDRGDDGEPRFAGNFGGGSSGGRSGFDRNAFEERIQNEINKLPPAERSMAQQEHDERKKFFDSLKDLTPEQRNQAFQAMMSDPAMQDKIENSNNARDARNTPHQRIAKAAGYLQRKAAASGR